MKPKIDILFLRVALKNGVLDEEQCEELVQVQTAKERSGERLPMARICLDRGLLDEAQVARILRAERYMEVRAADKHLARIYEMAGIATDVQIEEALAEQKRVFRGAAEGDFPRLNEVLEERGHVTAPQMEEAVHLHETTRGPSRRVSPSEAILKLRGDARPPDSGEFLTEVLEEFGIDRAEAEHRYQQEIQIYVECPDCRRSNLRSSTACRRCGAALRS